MVYNLIELDNKTDILNTYDIYKYCMYMPTKEKFIKKIDSFFNDDSVKIFSCRCDGEIKGIIVISFLESYKIEIIGIAVDFSSRKNGIATYMINSLISDYNINYIVAKTDNYAVDFYRKAGFTINKFIEKINGDTIVRYKCVLVK